MERQKTLGEIHEKMLQESQDRFRMPREEVEALVAGGVCISKLSEMDKLRLRRRAYEMADWAGNFPGSYLGLILRR